MPKIILIAIFLALVPATTLGQASSSAADPKCRKHDRGPEITFKPRPAWPENTGNFQGTVILRMEFLASGNIGTVKVVKSLPLGATENAIQAAMKIKFNPAIKKCEPITMFKQVEFLFSIY